MKKLTDQQLSILTLVGTFGYLATRDIGRLAWPSHPVKSAHVMAQDNASKLAKAGYLLARDMRLQAGMKQAMPAAKSGIAKGYVLTKKGAEALNDLHAERFIETPLPDGAPMLWFADGYNLSMTDHVTREPLIELLHAMTAADPTLSAVGARGASRNFLGLRPYAHFDALLVDEAGQFVFGVYLTNHNTAKSVADVGKLASAGDPFLIASSSPHRLATALKWRTACDATLDASVVARLPIDVTA